ncbi:phage tail tape measure protein [Variovorax sp. EL159]|uniref:phage tail tape measure protein n=1 Tax=Variovorax sp. EL159 TaxID=1566270 RepID=UPI00088251F7|nr:phage tail length tape measure family protein [Variovorax sp. EL159]SCX70906.1 phage tail tape measure protein, lambda family [Variovorax sp. EL159]
MAATQQMAIRMTMDASSVNADLSRVVNEFSKFIDRISSGASQAEEAKAKAAASAKEAQAKAEASIKEVSSSVQSLFSSIQGGQSPFTSFVSEGGKLVSTLGGIGPAAGAVGDYLLSASTRLNLATKAVTLLTEAYVEGSKEAVAYANANTMTGNYVGLTNDQLQTKAIEVAGTNGTQARAAEAVTAVVNTGRIGGDVVSEVAGATAEMNRVLGTSINEAVSNFVKLADEPSKASAKLNETYHYLSASTYERIVALEKQGKTEEAAALAQKTFAVAMKERTTEVVANLGSLQRAWLSITGFAEKAWDAMLNVGRPVTLQKQIQDVDKQIAQIDLVKQGNGFVSNGGGAAFGNGKAGAALDKARAEAVAKKATLEESLKLSSSVALNKANDARTQQVGIAKITKDNEKTENAGLRVGAGASGIARAEDDALRASIEAVREEYNAKARLTAEGFKNIDSLRKRDLLSDYGVVRQKRDLRLQDLKDQEEAIQKELQLLGSKKGSAADKRKLEAKVGEIDQQRGFVNAEAERTFAEMEAASQSNVLKTSQQATEKIREQVRAQEEQNAVYGMSKEAIQKLTIAQTERQIQELDATENVNPAYLKSLYDRRDAEKELLTAMETSERLKTTDEKQKKEKAKDEEKSKKMADDIGGVFRDGFVNLLEGGGRDAIDKIGEGLKKKLVKSLADAFYDATLKDAVDGFAGWLTGALKGSISGGGSKSEGGLSGLGGIFGAVSSLFGGFSGSTAAGLANVVGGSDPLGTMVGLMGLTKSANGNVFASPGLHAYANSVVASPTFFPFANGIGLMGEAGPEAIMPLRRGSDGRLGVSAPAGGGGGGGSLHYAPTNVFNIDSRSDRGAVLADLDRALQANNKGQMEQLKRLRVVPQ